MSRFKSIVFNKEFQIAVLFIAVFLLVRLPGIHLPYHQDEMKTARISNNDAKTSGNFYHPPLTQVLYRAENFLLGPDYFRAFTLIFGVLGAILVTLLVKHRLGVQHALYTLFLLSIGAYSVHASLMLDTDGAILPFFFLSSVYFYDQFYEASGKKRQFFFALLFFSLIIGFLVKLSFIIVVGTIICDFLYREKNRLNKKVIITFTLGILAFLAVFILAIFATKLIYPVFSISGLISHTESFINFGQRGWMQIIIQAVKAIFYLSPILIVLPLLITRDIFEKTRIFFIYLVLGFIFYFILFDFSQGALDKYLMFSIVPLTVIAGSIIASVFNDNKGVKKSTGIIIGALGSILIISLALLPHNVLPLYPKNLFVTSVLHFKWNTLFPFTGGSGPVGFYMSFLFIACSFILSSVIGVVAFFKKRWKYSAVITLLIISFTYNAVFVEEFLFGRLYGSAPKVLSESLDFIKNSSHVKQVISYNDIGAYELKKIAKYNSRFYAVPGNEEKHKAMFAAYKGHYLVIDMPKINESSFYGQFFSKCTSIFESKSGVIKGNVYSCPTTKK